MSYDEGLAERVQEVLQERDDISSRKMFGGLAYLVSGKLAVAVSGQGGLMLRCDPAETDEHCAGGAERMVMRGRELDGWLRLDDAHVSEDDDLERWVCVATSYADTLLHRGPRTGSDTRPSRRG